MTSLSTIQGRIDALTPTSQRQWGSMSIGQMLTHCTDQIQIILGEKPARPFGNRITRGLAKWVALNVPMRLPRNMKTVPELDPNGGLMTQPGEFSDDHDILLAALTRLHNLPEGQAVTHPVFGKMSKAQAIYLTHLHLDHHLRQFGV
ncbi:DUF1569 domain-containing protein [Fibrivirga algicola]|uniref:DUF1569 domain-containing protein n=1 Tax=Fibrivirga algicola TaxID=2950420 RepID=A0ABX0QPQ0_9BACT|nr:DUF1569 domain-containing protein [Fibrivirga algicola]NID13110.1 DUF1569 domain-containing protein [Fibrivirga algicola]